MFLLFLEKEELDWELFSCTLEMPHIPVLKDTNVRALLVIMTNKIAKSIPTNVQQPVAGD